MAAVLAAKIGFADAPGALAPPETPLHLEWPGTFRVNGARCGGLRAASAIDDPAEIPGRLVLAIEVPVSGPDGAEPGDRPDRTSLREEGIELSAHDLLGAWARRTLVRLDLWDQTGMARLHAEWRARA